MTVERIGHGAGRRDFAGAAQPAAAVRRHGGHAPQEQDQVWVLETNLDDLPAEVIGYCYELLLAAGALDVFSTPIFMKKNRPGVLLSVLAAGSGAARPGGDPVPRDDDASASAAIAVSRHKLQRRPCTVSTPWGPVQGKLGWSEGRPPVFSPEYEDCARVARQHGVALREVYAQVQQAYAEQAARLVGPTLVEAPAASGRVDPRCRG